MEQCGNSMESNKKLVEARVREELNRYFGSDEAVTCSHTETTKVDVQIYCRWELFAKEELEHRIGVHNIGEMFSTTQMAEAAALEYIRQIQRGECHVHNKALLDYINKNRLKAVWDSSVRLEDNRHISCVTICSPCDGEGQVNCSNCGGDGREACSNCRGRGLVKCIHCHGIGTIYDADGIRRACNYCFYRGEIDCRRCRGGYTDCTRCYGNGQLVCKNCKGTGRFTITRMFTVNGVQKQGAIAIEHQTETPDWIKNYIKEAAKYPDSHPLPLIQSISIHPPGIKFKTDYPYELKAPATLPATSAIFLGSEKKERQCKLLGEKLHSLDLGMVGETASSHLAQQVLDNKADLEKLQPLLQQRIFGILLPLRNSASTDIKKSYPLQVNLLSEEAGNNLLSAYSNVVNFFKMARSNLSIKSWLEISVVWMLLLFLFLIFINAIYIGQLDWSESGYTAHYYWQDLWGVAKSKNLWDALQLSFFIKFVETQQPGFIIRGLICTVFGVCLTKMFFLVPRALTFWRYIGEILIGACVGGVIFFLFYPAVSVVTTATVYPPSLNELITGGVMSLSLILEVIVLGLFAGLFHSRRKIDRRLRQQIKANNITELEEDLGYLKQG